MKINTKIFTILLILIPTFSFAQDQEIYNAGLCGIYKSKLIGTFDGKNLTDTQKNFRDKLNRELIFLEKKYTAIFENPKNQKILESASKRGESEYMNHLDNSIACKKQFNTDGEIQQCRLNAINEFLKKTQTACSIPLQDFK